MHFGSRSLHAFSRRTFRPFLILSLLAALAAGCGGGGGSSPDTTPDAFSFTAATNQEPNAVASSNAVTITGIDNGTALSITGGSYSLDNGSTFATAATTINANQSVIVRGTASGEFATTTQVVLTVGTVTQSFSITTRARDTQPDALGEFTAVTNGDPSTAYTSNAITVNGVEGAVTVSITNGTYDINGSDTFTASAGTVSNGQTLRVRVTTAATFDTPVTATLTVGSVTRSFSVTALADTTPNGLGFGGTSAAQAPSAVYTSAELPVAGINTAANVAISGADAQYRIRSGDTWGDYTNAAGQVSAGDLVQVRATAPAIPASSVDIALTVGTLTETLALQTAPDTTPPTAQVVFPTRVALTQKNYLHLRGTAEDDFSAVTEIRVRVTRMEGETPVEVATQTVLADEGESLTEWTARVENIALNTVNTVSVSAVDALGNVQGVPAVVEITQSETEINFPVGNSVHFGALEYNGIDYDAVNNRFIVPGIDPANLYAVDATTGVRSLFLEEQPEFQSLSMVHVLNDQGEVLIADQNAGAIYKVDLDGTNFSILSDSATSGSNVNITFPFAMRLHMGNGLLYVIDGQEGLYTVDLSNQVGVRTAVSNDNIPEGGANIFVGATGVALDEANNRAVVVDWLGRKLFFVDLSSGERMLLSEDEEIGAPFDVAIDGVRNQVLFTDREAGKLFAIGLSEPYFVTTVVNDLNLAPGLSFAEGPFGFYLDQNAGLAYVIVGSGTRRVAIRVVDVISGELVDLSLANP